MLTRGFINGLYMNADFREELPCCHQVKNELGSNCLV